MYKVTDFVKGTVAYFKTKAAAEKYVEDNELKDYAIEDISDEDE
jgi:hypothetical protein